MPDEASSLHLRNTHELFLLVPVKPGFIEGADRRTSYASRLRMLLNLLFAPTQSVVERTLMPRLSFADELQNIYHFHYGVVQRFQRSELILSATFDSSWEAYFRNLVDGVGDFLDAVFCHCEGFEGRTCRDGYEPFASFIREHQVQAGILYTATPDLTTDDLRMLRQMGRGQKVERPARSPQDDVAVQEQAWRARYQSDAWQGPEEFQRLRNQSIVQFVNGLWEARKLFPAAEQVDGAQSYPRRSAQMVFDDVVGLLAKSLSETELMVGAEAVLANAKDDDPKKVADLKPWLNGITARKRATQPALPPPAETPDHSFQEARVQENIYSSVESEEGLLALLRFPSTGAAPLVRALAAAIKKFPAKKHHLNVGFTHAGLRRLGLDDATLELFPKEFREGMEQRSGSLGDVGWPNHPEYWHLVGGDGGRLSLASVDVVVLLHRKKDASKTPLKDVLLGDLLGQGSADVAYTEYLARLDPDHFGFPRATLQNQPDVRLPQGGGGPAKPVGQPFDNGMELGELFLGYPNSHGKIARAATKRHNKYTSELFIDGTFLVIRKLAQNRQALDRQLHAGCRSRSSALGMLEPPIASTADYASEPQKSRSALDSHVRRVNARERGVPRIVRRSFSYGTPTNGGSVADNLERGHMFMAYNANIAQQFEVLQRWINGGNPTGVLSSETDALAAQNAAIHGGGTRDPSAAPPVSLRWGMYLFVPSKLALEFLADVAHGPHVDASERALGRRKLLRTAEQAWLVKRGSKLIKELDGISDPIRARDSWRQLFEEYGPQTDARAVWAAIRETDAPKPTPYGLLIGTRASVDEVVRDDGSRFSVRTYRERLKVASSGFYLGLDASTSDPSTGSSGGCPMGYSTLARANLVLREQFKTLDVFKEARGHARKFLEEHAPGFELSALARQVVGKISLDHIGLPSSLAKDEVQLRAFLDNFMYITRYMSFPYPEDWVTAKAQLAGKELSKRYADDKGGWGPFATKLQTSNYGERAVICDAIIGANIGFVPPAVAMIAGVLSRWLENGDLEHLEPHLGKAELRPVLIRELKSDPTFSTMYRTATDHVQNREQHPPIKDGTFVIVGMQSAYEDAELAGEAQPEYWLFGGEFGGARHGCPMADYALDVIAGAVMGVVDHLQDVLIASPRCKLVRSGPLRYEVATLGRVLPGQDLP